ncbi:hypothetical protein A7U60_g9051 [Sanghuangporus baumii]|uniref:Uncharacterized protein n=1 Tax=Sanghuangporus baumii TaxID=108892 RepID=A0A9Q5HPZ1_SANBA|nr:hypothetical protein A7U60_g9051 [Sanghuangporus baumii]
MNPNASPYQPPRFYPPPSEPQHRTAPHPRPHPQPSIYDAKRATNMHFAIFPNARNTRPHLKGRQMPPANHPVVQPHNGSSIAMIGPEPAMMFGSVTALPQAANGVLPAHLAMYQQAYLNQYPQLHPAPTRVISGGRGLGPQRGPAVGNTDFYGQGYNYQYWQGIYNPSAEPSSGSIQGSSGAGSASSSSQPSPSSSSTSMGINAPSYISYQGLPLPVCRNPLSPSLLPLPSVQEYNERKDLVRLHSMLGVSSRHLLRWNVNEDPYYAQCDGRRITYDEQLEPAFLEPGCKAIIVVVALDCSEAKGFAMLEPENGQRLYCFPVSACPGSVCLQKLYAEEVLLGNSWKEEDTLYVTSDSKSETSSQVTSTPGTQQAAPSSSDLQSPEKDQEQNGQPNVDYKLDIRGVLDGIRDGLRTPLSHSEWSTLTLHEKFTLACRVSARRSEWDSLSSSCCNVDFLKRTLELEAALSGLQNHGDVISYNKACDAIREAHKRLDAYVFESGYSDDTEINTTNVKANDELVGAFRKAGRSKEGRDERGREPVRVIDFFPPGKTTFKGLRWMGWKPAGGIDAYFLCLA